MPITETTIRLTTGVPGCVPCGCTTGFGSICDTAVFPVPPAVPSLRGLITTIRHTGGVLTPEPYFVEVAFTYHPEAYPRAVTLPGSPALYDADSHWPFAGFWRADCVIYGDDEAVGPFGTSDFRDVVTIALLPGPAIGGGGNRIGAVYVESFRAVVGGVAEPVDDAAARCAAIGDQIFADDNGDWPEGSTHPVVQVTDCASLCFNGTAADPLDFLATLPGGAPIRIGESDPFGPWDVSATACVTAKRPDCGETPGELLVGVDAELALIGPGGLTSIGGGTTDGSGRSCLPVTATGLYQWTVTDADGCEATARFGIVPCQDDGTTIESTAVACCATVKVPVIKDEDDGALEGATVSVGGFEDVVTDVDGAATFTLPSDYILGLPITGEDCAREVVVTVTGPELDPPRVTPRCETLVIRCGDTAATAHDPIRLALVPEHYTVRTTGPSRCCGAIDCTQLISGHALVADGAGWAVSLDFRDTDNNVVGTVPFEAHGINPIDDPALQADGVHTYLDPGCGSATVTSWTTYYNGISDVPYQSAQVDLYLCPLTGLPYVRVRIWRRADCTPLDEFGSFPGDNDIELSIPLPAEATLCHPGEIDESGVIGDPEAAHVNWTFSAVAA